jgi:hypothetical protein
MTEYLITKINDFLQITMLLLQFFAFIDDNFADMDKISHKNQLRREKPSAEDLEQEKSLETQKFEEFMRFTGLPPTHCRILNQLIHHQRRMRNQHADEILYELSQTDTHKEIVQALEELLVDGWIMMEYDGPFSSRDAYRITANIDVALKTKNAAILPVAGKAVTEEPILKVHARAVSLRCKNIGVDDWVAFAQETAAPILLKYFEKKQIARLNPAEWGILAYVTSIYVVEEKGQELTQLLDLFSKNAADKMVLRKVLNEECSTLFTSGLLVKDSSFRGISAYYPANFTHKKVPNDGWRNRPETPKSSPAFTIVNHKSIHGCELFFNESVAPRIEQITCLLDQKKFEVYKKTMLKKGKPNGITLLLHGPPGTGKTELARQIAKKTGRDLLYFEVAQQRDMYLGESEKKIKEVFTSYTQLSQKSKLAPVLLFNEADSIFHTRTESGINTSHTDNAVQTILLNELETFNGILIATTNRPHTLDPAFDRRFMFKLKIENPELIVREKLLRKFYHDLPDSIIKEFASEFLFTAAQLEQFDRQLEISRLLEETNPESLLSEKLYTFLAGQALKARKATKRIGFL